GPLLCAICWRPLANCAMPAATPDWASFAAPCAAAAACWPPLAASSAPFFNWSICFCCSAEGPHPVPAKIVIAAMNVLRIGSLAVIRAFLQRFHKPLRLGEEPPRVEIRQIPLGLGLRPPHAPAPFGGRPALGAELHQEELS